MRRASGWSPAVTSSPLIKTRLRMPRAAAPSRSACKARRFRSRTVSCMIGSMPRSASKCAAAIEDRCTWAPVLSVQLMASATPRSWSPLRPTTSGSALSLEASSAVTTNCPARSRSARRLMPDTLRPTLRGTPVTTADQVDPGRRALQLPVDRLLQVLDVATPERQLARTFPGLDPDAALVRVHLAIAIGTHAAAWPIAQVLRATHRTAHPGRVQDALAAHAAIPNRLFERLLDGKHQALGEAHRVSPCAASCR